MQGRAARACSHPPARPCPPASHRPSPLRLIRPPQLGRALTRKSDGNAAFKADSADFFVGLLVTPGAPVAGLTIEGAGKEGGGPEEGLGGPGWVVGAHAGGGSTVSLAGPGAGGRRRRTRDARRSVTALPSSARRRISCLLPARALPGLCKLNARFVASVRCGPTSLTCPHLKPPCPPPLCAQACATWTASLWCRCAAAAKSCTLWAQSSCWLMGTCSSCRVGAALHPVLLFSPTLSRGWWRRG